jgi:Zn ribbon nucleic-acid-binding protein
MSDHRFKDQHKILDDFQNEVWVHCPQCEKQAVARLKSEEKKVSLHCICCGFYKEVSTLSSFGKNDGVEIRQAAHVYFNATLWYSHPFRASVFWAYNPDHLHYLEGYIAAKLREQRDRQHFTLLEKLPKFYHNAKNREALLKIIEKLKKK